MKYEDKDKDCMPSPINQKKMPKYKNVDEYKSQRDKLQFQSEDLISNQKQKQLWKNEYDDAKIYNEKRRL